MYTLGGENEYLTLFMVSTVSVVSFVWLCHGIYFAMKIGEQQPEEKPKKKTVFDFTNSTIDNVELLTRVDVMILQQRQFYQEQMISKAEFDVDILTALDSARRIVMNEIFEQEMKQRSRKHKLTLIK